MAVTHEHPITSETPTQHAAASTTWVARVAATLRIGFGLTFLWAFVDKVLALGFHTGYDQTGALDRFGDAAWINGGSPTEGFLKFGADGPFKGFYNSIGGTVFADTLFMAGLLGIGIALTFGIGMRLATGAGVLMYVLMWSVVLPPENNPILDDHLLSAGVLVLLLLVGAGRTWGLGSRLETTRLVKRYPVLR
jgi:thiosulfate dehydrogenase [quinone] large subunit